MTMPGARTLRTAELNAMLNAGGRPPIILVTARPRADFALPGEVEFRGVFTDQDAADGSELRRRIAELTGGDLATPLVTASWNAERWSARNLALSLTALGYRSVYWYRGGLEAWDVAGLPRNPVQPDDH